MARTFADLILEPSNTLGTADYELQGAAAGYRAFANGYVTGDTPYYVVRNRQDTKYEVNRGGVFTAPGALTRGVILSSNANAAVSWTTDDLPLSIYCPRSADIDEGGITGWWATTRSALIKFGLWWQKDTPSAGLHQLTLFDGVADTYIGELNSVNHSFKGKMYALALTPATAVEANEGGEMNISTATSGTHNLTIDAYQNTHRAFAVRKSDGVVVQLWSNKLDGTGMTYSTTVFAPGAQIQMVSVQTGAVATGTTLLPIDDTIPQQTEGNQYMTLAITPKSATSSLQITVTIVLAHSVVSTGSIALFKDAAANAVASVIMGFSTTENPLTTTFTHTMTSGSVAATTFKVRAGSNVAGTTTFNGASGGRMHGGVLASSIVIREVMP